MDVIKELNNLPNFGYVLFRDGKDRIAILGGNTCQRLDAFNNLESFFILNFKMQEIYGKEVLDIDDKIELANCMSKMMSLCEGRLTKNYTIEEQKNYIDSLSNETQEDLKKQIQMYKDAREYYRQYVFSA